MTASAESYALIHDLIALGIGRPSPKLPNNEVLIEITSKLEFLLINESATQRKEQMKISTDRFGPSHQVEQVSS